MYKIKLISLLFFMSISTAFADSPFFQSPQSNTPSTANASSDEFKKQVEVLSQQNQVRLNTKVSKILSTPPIPPLPNLNKNNKTVLPKDSDVATKQDNLDNKPISPPTEKTVLPPPKTVATPVSAPTPTNDTYTGFVAPTQTGTPASTTNQSGGQWNIKY